MYLPQMHLHSIPATGKYNKINISSMTGTHVQKLWQFIYSHEAGLSKGLLLAMDIYGKGGNEKL